MSFDKARRLLRSGWPVAPLPQSNELACAREIRAELAAAYPRVRVSRIRKLVRKFGLKTLPAGMLLQNSRLAGSLFRMFLAQFPGGTRAVKWHPLFDESSYRLLNPDVAAIRVSPWLHFQVFGRAEGRSPHPFIDVDFLSASMPSVLRGEVIDHYLSLPEFWMLDPSPYVDVQAFLLSGRWDGRTHPLTQIVAQGLSSQWVHHRLMLIDNAGDVDGGSRVLAAATLLAREGSPSRLLQLKTWRVAETATTAPLGEREYTVVPGFFLGYDDVVLSHARAAALSPDGSMINMGADIVSVNIGSHIAASEFLVLDGALSRRELSEVLDAASHDTIISPSSGWQQQAVEEIIRARSLKKIRVLPIGVQVRVTTSRMSIIPASEREVAPGHWSDHEISGANRTAVVIRTTRVSHVLAMPMVRRAVEGGAVLCVIHNEDFSPWSNLLNARDLIVCESSMVEALSGFVDNDGLRLLPAPDEGPKK